MENEVDGVVEEDERHQKNPEMWREQQPKMKILLHRLEKKHGFKATHIYSWSSNGFAAHLNKKQLEDIKTIPGTHIEENQQYSVAAAIPWSNQIIGGQTVSWGIYATGANLSSARSGANSQIKDLSKTRIYILDTGVSLHPDLNVMMRSTATIDGTIDDCQGHGTAVAGPAAAKNNGTGVAGVAPGAPIISIKIFEGCSGENTSTSNLLRGIDIAVQNEANLFYNRNPAEMGAAVMNISIEGPIAEYSLFPNDGSPSVTAVKDALRKAATSTVYRVSYYFGVWTVNVKGIFSSLAAGNSNRGACLSSPAAFGRDIEGAVTVSATDKFDTVAAYLGTIVQGGITYTRGSNYGRCVELWAPGRDIFTTRLNSPPVEGSGTSLSAPLVAGMAALISDKYRNLLPKDIEALLKFNSNYAGQYLSPSDSAYLPIYIPQAHSY